MKLEEFIDAYSMEQFWRMKLGRVAEMINNEAIDLDSLVNSLKMPYNYDYGERWLDSFLFGVPQITNLFYTFFGFGEKNKPKVIWLNELRFTDLPSLVNPTNVIYPNPLLLVYKLHVDSLREHYEETNGRRTSNSFILRRFYYSLSQPRFMFASLDHLNKKTLRGYFALSKVLKGNEKVYPWVFDLAMELLVGQNSKEKELSIEVPPIFRLAFLESKESFGYLWLLFGCFV